jgi:predicted nuclease of restriction endonuclease-like (RecB) superfamily
MHSEIAGDKQYKRWVVDLKERIRGAQIKAALSVNRELLHLYWELGCEIVEKEKTPSWGEGLIEQLSQDLSSAFPGMKGFSRRNLFYVKRWYSFYCEAGEKVPQLVAQIPWGHNREIITKCQTIEEALFYVHETIQNNWSRAILVLHMESDLYRRQGKAIENFDETLPPPQADLARETLKNSYNFDFLTLGKEAEERDIEAGLITHIQKFLIELGQGFAFLGRQCRINVGGEDFYMDMLFYHVRLRCYVVIELKATGFKPEYAGKLNFYLNVVNAQMRRGDDQPSIGILLCKSSNKVIVEYALHNTGGPVGVTEYQTMNSIPDKLRGSLPSKEDLEEQLS